jgi:hypothetical protein
MMGRWMMFRKIVCIVGFAGLPVNFELVLLLSVHEPEVAHVEGF